MLAYLFGIKPWEVGRLTVPEFEQFVTEAEQYLEEQRKAAQKSS